MKKMFLYIKDYWKEHNIRIVILIVFSLLNTLMIVFYPLLLKNIIDGLLSNAGSKTLFKYLVLLIAASVGSMLFYSTVQTNRVYINSSFFWKMNMDLILFILKQGKKFFSRFSTGDLITRLIDDTEKLAWYSCSGVFRFFDGVSVLAVSFIFMSGMSVKLTLYLVLPIAVIVFLLVFFDDYWEKAFQNLQSSISEVNQNIEKAFSSIKVIKSANMEEFAREEFGIIMNKRRKRELKVVFFDALWHSIDIFINYFGYLIIIYFGGKMVIREQLTLGSFVAYTQYLNLMMEYLYSTAYFFLNTRRNSVSAGRHLELYANKNMNLYENEFENHYDSLSRIQDIESIEFRGVSLKLGEREIFQNLSFKIFKGEFVGITGKVGSGKTMLTELLLGLLEPTSGEILINGIPMKRINISSYQDFFGYVFQESFLFSTSIGENIVFETNPPPVQHPGITKNEIYAEYCNKSMVESIFMKNTDTKIDEESELEVETLDYDFEGDSHYKDSIKLAALDDDLEMFPDHSDTVVGTKGIMVSGGQRERITIARAMYKNPKIYIFDDSTRSLDTKTEKKILNNIKAISQSATILMITHRLESLKDADRIINLD